MGAIGLNPIRLDRIGLDPIRVNAIRLGVPGAASGSDRPYIDPEVLASLKAVCICYGKSNDDPDRAVVKNLVDPDNPFIISNAAFKLNSGFGEYEVDFLDWSINSSTITERTSFAFSAINTTNSDIISIYQIVPAAVQSLKIKVNLSGRLLYRYYVNNGDTISVSYYEVKEGINILPDSVDPTSVSGKVGFVLKGLSSVKLEQIPSFEGAFVTDGIDDLITSTKTVQEMGITDEVTVVSMIHQIALNPTYNVGTTNYLENLDNGKHIRSDVYYAGKTGIYGYTASLINNTASDIKNILGDKADYSTQKNEPSQTLHNSKFSVVGRARNFTEPSSVAWYWTVIANKVLTTDQINQIIAYYNLDRCVEPTVWYDVQKQGLTNDTPDSDWYLKDFSKNGFDMSLFNFAKDGGSGIGKYNYPNWKITVNKAGKYRNIKIYQTLNGTYTAEFKGVTELYNRVGIELEILSKNRYVRIKEDGIYSVDPVDDATELQVRFGDYTDTELYDCDITITQIPSHAGGLCLDGINDFGKVTGMPIYKDYTVIADYERFYLEPITGGRASILSKSSKVGDGSFIFNLETQDGGKACYTFGEANGNISDDITRIIRYQSKYYNTKTLSIGTAEDNDFMVLGKVREVDSRYFCGAIYSLMSFPYSMPEFLIERQLKKHKLGTLYPNMVEFRPVIKANANYKITYYQIDSTNTWKLIKVGYYIVIGAKLAFQITFDNDASELKEVVSPQLSGIIVEKRPSNPGYNIYSYITSKSPQKINLVIFSYLTMLNNETLISNETLIKNE